MKTLLVRVLSGLFGAIAALIAIGAPLSFIVITATEIDSAKQYQGHISVFGLVGTSLLIFALATLFGIAGYKLLRRAAGDTRPASHV